MAKKNSYQEYIKKEFTELINKLDLSELQKQFMKSRWLDQIMWLESQAGNTKKWSTRLRLMTIVGGVIIPALVSLNFNKNDVARYGGWATFGLSQMVAISAAVEEYFSFKDKHILYRQTAESLKSEMWKFVQLTGSYQQYSDHKQGYPTFAFRVEKFIQQDVQAIVELAKESATHDKLEEHKQKSMTSTSSGSTSSSSVSESSKMLPPVSTTTKKS
ncbi:MAG: DUF4231 domain-containing protein [Cyanobacteria bacterium J06633_8]